MVEYINGNDKMLVQFWHGAPFVLNPKSCNARFFQFYCVLR